jgi:5-formyltetrahydrofolate cyclo-ligase
VAVSRDGYRIGKGKGYADLEYAILKEMKAVDDDTTIVTTVHDSQVCSTQTFINHSKFSIIISGF